MWLYPFLTIATIAGILAVLVQLGLTEDTRSQLFLGLGSWAVALVVYVVIRRMGGSISAEELEAQRQEEPVGGS
jgi:GABA permease